MKLRKIVFDKYSQTFRLMPQNYWLASIKNNKLVFDSWDGMTKQILKYNILLRVRTYIKYLIILIEKK